MSIFVHTHLCKYFLNASDFLDTHKILNKRAILFEFSLLDHKTGKSKKNRETKSSDQKKTKNFLLRIC